jgi:hypothetical protein
LFVHACFVDVVSAFVDVEELNDVDVLEEVLQDWMVRLMTQVHDGDASPNQKSNDYPRGKIAQQLKYKI